MILQRFFNSGGKTAMPNVLIEERSGRARRKLRKKLCVRDEQSYK
jgi:hypothetical protein